MASGHSPFSFHCMICFEEFHPTERYPVVLPCGHTYVCSTCANRLEKCMECRTPLFSTVKGSSGSSGGSTRHGGNEPSQDASYRSGWSNARSGVRTSRYDEPNRQQPVIKKRLPLPKNVVLLSLIEATELATQDLHPTTDDETTTAMDADFAANEELIDGQLKKSGSYPRFHSRRNHPGVYMMNSMIDSEEDEEEKIKVGTSLAVGVAGTYAVASREGMEIFQTRPSTAMTKRMADDSQTEVEVDSLVQNMHDSKVHSDGESPKKGSFDGAHGGSAKLSFGDRVQVVSLEDGWAKLARGYGYVRADRNRLVKVGNSVDRACKLEAMLRNLTHRRKMLRMEQSKVDNQFIRLMNDLQQSLQHDEDLTVILADAFAPDGVIPEASYHAEKKEDTPTTAEVAAASQPPITGDVDTVDIQKPTKLKQTKMTSPPVDRPSFVCFAGDVFSGYSMDQTENNDNGQGTSSPTGSLNGLASALFPSSSNPSPSALRAGAQAWRERHGQSPRQGIDFRTGMSGHTALLSTHAHPHEYLVEPSSSTGSSSTYTYQRPKMSSHTGLTVRNSTVRSIMASLTLPSFGLTTRQVEDDRRDELQQSGSM